MSQLDIRALEANFEGWKKERAPNLTPGDAFERFSAELILKDADLSDEEFATGLVGGGDDGGIDGMYFFINRILMQDENEAPDPALTAQLVLIQSKYQPGFAETVVDKFKVFTEDLLNFAKPIESLTYLNSDLRDLIALFRTSYGSILGSQHNFTISYNYASKSQQDPNAKVKAKVENLERYVKSQINAANFEFEFWGCNRLLTAARTPPKRRLVLDISKYFTTDDNSVVCLVGLKKFATFLTDERGYIRRSILEPNVRDYQGRRNAVNTDIRATLNNAEGGEFWWLNNGVTILATECSIAGNKLTVEKPGIVNGLQTSQEIFSHFKEHPDSTDIRSVLVRVLVPPDEQIRNRITKATNSQTAVNPVFLRATDQIHFDIEEKLKLYDLYYDRRRGEYGNLRKPISKIISIRSLARSAMAIVIQQPDDARARPQSVLNREETYKKVFNDLYNRDLYVACILLDRQVDSFLVRLEGVEKDAKRDIKYYLETWISCLLTERASPTPEEIASMLSKCVAQISDEILSTSTKALLALYKELGATDKVAKSTAMRTEVLRAIRQFIAA